MDKDNNDVNVTFMEEKKHKKHLKYSFLTVFIFNTLVAFIIEMLLIYMKIGLIGKRFLKKCYIILRHVILKRERILFLY